MLAIFTYLTYCVVNKFFGQRDDGLRTGPKHVAVYYILLLTVIFLCSWLYVNIDIYTLQLCIITVQESKDVGSLKAALQNILQSNITLFLFSNFRRVVNVVYFPLGDSPGVWFLCADVSEHSVCSIFIGRVDKKTTYEYHPKERIRHTFVCFICFENEEKKTLPNVNN